MNSGSTSAAAASPLGAWDYLRLTAMPLFFASNLVIGRSLIGEVGPWTLALLRWLIAFLLLLPLTGRDLLAIAPVIRDEWRRFLTLGFLGMGLCGGLIYYALATTSATNGNLIYASAPAMMVLLDRFVRGVPLGRIRALGIVICLLGVLAIVLRGSAQALLDLRFSEGDLIFAFGAIAWAIYTLLLHTPRLDALPVLPVFAAVAGVGALVLLPFSLAELAVGGIPTIGATGWLRVASLAVVSSILAFASLQWAMRRAGSSIAGAFLYLIPVFSVALAVIFLDEAFELYHLVGLALIVGGVVLATRGRKPGVEADARTA